MLTRGRKRLVWTAEMDALFAHMNDVMISSDLLISAPTVARRRKELGLPKVRVRKPQEPQVTWTPEMDALLGTDYDKVIGEKLGLHYMRVYNRRVQLGIPPISRFAARWKDPEFIKQLGTCTDAEIAQKMGVSRERIRTARKLNGIPRFETLKPDWASVADRIGKEPDSTIAKELGVSATAVLRYRTSHKMPLVHTSTERTLDFREDVPANWREMLGKVSDYRLVRQWGVALSPIIRIRNKLGIPPFVPRAAVKADWKDPALVARLGKETDASLAKSLGLSISTVTARRRSLGIAPLNPKKSHTLD